MYDKFNFKNFFYFEDKILFCRIDTRWRWRWTRNTLNIWKCVKAAPSGQKLRPTFTTETRKFCVLLIRGFRQGKTFSKKLVTLTFLYFAKIQSLHTLQLSINYIFRCRCYRHTSIYRHPNEQLIMLVIMKWHMRDLKKHTVLSHISIKLN